MPYRVGQTATDPKTGEKIAWDGENWVDAGKVAPRAAAPKLSNPAQSFLNTLSQQAAEAAETSRIYDTSKKSIESLNPGPNRGRFLEVATPEENGGVLDTLGAIAVGAPARVLGAITQPETDAYQQLRGLQSKQVLSEQLLQKGPQTESDAARLMLTEISPMKSKEVNEDIINRGQWKAKRVQAKATFYAKWANKYGLNGVSEHGNTADQVWAKQGDRLTEAMFGPRTPQKKGGGVEIKVLSKTKVK